MEVPVGWVKIREKMKRADIDTAFDAFWYPGYEAACQAFDAWLDKLFRVVTSDSVELRALGWPIQILGVSSRLRSQAQTAFRNIINTALGQEPMPSEDSVIQQLGMVWIQLESRARADAIERTRSFGATLKSYYEPFLRKYFLGSVPIQMMLRKVWQKMLRPLLKVAYLHMFKVLRGRIPGPAAAAERGMVRIGRGIQYLKSLKGVIRKYSNIRALVRPFIDWIKGGGKAAGIVGPGIAEVAARGLPAAGILSTFVAFLLAVLLYSERVEAPTLSDSEIERLYADPGLMPLRKEVADVAGQVHGIKQGLVSLQNMITGFGALETEELEKGFSEKILAQTRSFEDAIRNLRLSVGDEHLARIRKDLLDQVSTIKNQGILSSAVGPEMSSSDISEEQLDSYYDVGAILSILLPAIKELDPEGTKDAEMVIEQATELRRPELEQYAQTVGERVARDEAVYAGSDVEYASLEMVAEAGEQLEKLLNAKVTDTAAYRVVVSQIGYALPNLEFDDAQIAEEILLAAQEAQGALGG